MHVLLAFFSALVQADLWIVTHVVPNVAIAVDKAQRNAANIMNVAKMCGRGGEKPPGCGSRHSCGVKFEVYQGVLWASWTGCIDDRWISYV